MKHFKKFLERLVEGALTLSGTVTSITILLIVIFLFKEGAGLFNSSSIEKGYALYTHSDNPVGDLEIIEIKDVFDSNISNWKELGGKDEEIFLFRFNEIFKLYKESRSEEHTSELQS